MYAPDQKEEHGDRCQIDEYCVHQRKRFSIIEKIVRMPVQVASGAFLFAVDNREKRNGQTEEPADYDDQRHFELI